MTDPFWAGRRVLVTGHTGFKGAWLAFWLGELGAEVTGLALPALDDRGAYVALRPVAAERDLVVDVRDERALRGAVEEAAPEIVFHLAAQALVRASWANPIATFETNVLGTANLLAAVDATPAVQATVVVTSDKVYEPCDRAHREDDPLGGRDPYSASKAAAELVVRTWPSRPGATGRTVTARAGNVLGGGDRGADRLLPDVLRAHESDEPVVLRHPEAVRPWQFVLEPLSGYLDYARQLAPPGAALPPSLNFGPSGRDALTVAGVVELVAERLGARGWVRGAADDHAPETPVLRLDATLAGEVLGWRPRTSVLDALAWTIDWHVAEANGSDLRDVARRQIDDFTSR